MQPQAKATWRVFYARAVAVSLQCKMENMLHRQAGTLPFPFPAIPVTNTVTYCQLLLQLNIPLCLGTHSEHLSSPDVVLITETQLFTRLFPPSTFLFPLIGKNKLAMSWQICLSKANVASSNMVSEDDKRVSAKELKQLPQQVRGNPILPDSHTVQQDCENSRTQNSYHSSAIVLAEWIPQSVVQL